MISIIASHQMNSEVDKNENDINWDKIFLFLHTYVFFYTNPDQIRPNMPHVVVHKLVS